MRFADQLEKLIEKCRKSDVRACEELKDYRNWLKEKLNRRENVVGSSLLGLLITIPLYALPQILNIPKLAYVFIAIYTVLTTLVIIYLTSCIILERYIKKLYEVLIDPEMPWKIDWAFLIMGICGIALGILGIYLTITTYFIS